MYLRITKIFSLLLITAVVMMSHLAPAQAESPNDILVIANQTCPDDTITIDRAKAIFMKRRTIWSNNQKLIALNAKEGTALRDAFRTAAIKMNAIQEKTHWQNQKVRHGITPPPEFTKLQKAVFKIKGAVSYVFRKDFIKGVSKVLLVIPSSTSGGALPEP